MKNLLCYLFTSLVHTSAATIPPLAMLNTSELTDPAANQAAIGTPDPLFKIEPNLDGQNLPLVSCLMNTIAALEELGIGNFGGRIQETTYKLDTYRQVGIIVVPRIPGGTIERRFVIWGLSMGATFMIDYRYYAAGSFILTCTYTFANFFFVDPGVMLKPRESFYEHGPFTVLYLVARFIFGMLFPVENRDLLMERRNT